MIKEILSALAFTLRHLLMVPLAMLAGCVLWTIAYVLLLIASMIWGGGLGGPLAYPGGIIAIVLTVMVVGWGIFAPSTLVGAVICKVFAWPRLAAIPFVFVSGYGFSYLVYWAFIQLVTTSSMSSAAEVLKNYVIFLSLPLGGYWWLTEGPGAIFDVCRRIYRKFKDRKVSRKRALLGIGE